MAGRKDRIYAVCWTWKKHRIVPTKKRGEEVLRVWKRWKERQGLSISRLGDGYVARREGALTESISLHTYDVITKERIYRETDSSAKKVPIAA